MTITVEPIELPALPELPPVETVSMSPPRFQRNRGTTREEIRVACEQVIASDGDFAILESLETPYHYMQWIEHDGAVHVEIADPTYNEKPALDERQLSVIEELGFKKSSVNFVRDFAPEEHDASSLAVFVLDCFERVFGVGDVSRLEIAGS